MYLCKTIAPRKLEVHPYEVYGSNRAAIPPIQLDRNYYYTGVTFILILKWQKNPNPNPWNTNPKSLTIDRLINATFNAS